MSRNDSRIRYDEIRGRKLYESMENFNKTKEINKNSSKSQMHSHNKKIQHNITESLIVHFDPNERYENIHGISKIKQFSKIENTLQNTKINLGGERKNNSIISGLNINSLEKLKNIDTGSMVNKIMENSKNNEIEKYNNSNISMINEKSLEKLKNINTGSMVNKIIENSKNNEIEKNNNSNISMINENSLEKLKNINTGSMVNKIVEIKKNSEYNKSKINDSNYKEEYKNYDNESDINLDNLKKLNDIPTKDKVDELLEDEKDNSLEKNKKDKASDNLIQKLKNADTEEFVKKIIKNGDSDDKNLFYIPNDSSKKSKDSYICMPKIEEHYQYNNINLFKNNNDKNFDKINNIPNSDFPKKKIFNNFKMYNIKNDPNNSIIYDQFKKYYKDLNSQRFLKNDNISNIFKGNNDHQSGKNISNNNNQNYNNNNIDYNGNIKMNFKPFNNNNPNYNNNVIDYNGNVSMNFKPFNNNNEIYKNDNNYINNLGNNSNINNPIYNNPAFSKQYYNLFGNIV